MKKTYTDIQIRFADVDFLGHVNNVNLQHYFDIGKSAYYREILGMDAPDGPQGIITAATSTSYLAQTRMTDRIYVETAITETGNKSMIFGQRIVEHATGETKAESRSVMVAFDFERQETIPVPDEWRRVIESE